MPKGYSLLLVQGTLWEKVPSSPVPQCERMNTRTLPLTKKQFERIVKKAVEHPPFATRKAK